MNIIFISQECYPFAKASGLGDLVSFLAKEIEKEGHNLKIFIPRYGSIDPASSYIEKLPLEPVISFNGTQVKTMVFKGILPNSLVSVFFIESQNHFSNSKDIYLESVQSDVSKDRNKFFSIASLEIINKLKFEADIIHFFNPGTAYVGKLLNERKEKKEKVVFSIYNILEADTKSDAIRNTKDAIKSADFVTTVSEGYANELLNDTQIGLDLVLKEKGGSFLGLLNGIDENIYNPEVDKEIAQTFSKNYFSAGKKKCKEELLSSLNFESSVSTPVFSMVTKLSNDKGFDLLINSIPHLASLNLQLVILGKGKSSYEQELVKIANKFSSIKVIIDFNNSLARKIYAGSDFFLNPGKVQSSGTSVLIAMKYGCIPVSFFGGAMKDLLIDIEDEEKGNGILFNDYSKEDLINAVNKALKFYKNKDRWTNFVKEAMNYESEKLNASKTYLKCYKHILSQNTLHDNVYQ